MRALLVQALKPRVMAAVDQHSPFRYDFWGRINRTGEYIMVTTFGTSEEALRISKRVRAEHRRISGVDPVTGSHYSASDPELLLWVHAAEVDSFLAGYRAYGGNLTPTEATAYVAEMVTAAELVGLHPLEVPASTEELSQYLDSQDDLALTKPAREGLRLLLDPPLPPLLVPLWRLVTTATVAILPQYARELYGLQWPSLLTPPLRSAVRTAVTALRAARPGPPHARAARQRTGGH
jgi:uncharacterized protein (DUF2236 family)